MEELDHIIKLDFIIIFEKEDIELTGSIYKGLHTHKLDYLHSYTEGNAPFNVVKKQWALTPLIV